MKDDAYRRILQLERRVQSMAEQLEALRTRGQKSLPAGGSPVILQAVSDIVGSVASGSDWNIYRGNARIYNLQIRGNLAISEFFTLSKVTGNSVDRVVPLANLWNVPILQDSFVLGFPMGGHYVTASPPFGLFRFTINAGFSSGTANASLLTMAGTDTGADVAIQDPLLIFSSLSTGDAGICILWGDKYYAIQAPCPA